MNHEVVNPVDRLISEGARAEYSSLAEEWRAAREACAVFPAHHRAIARATGEDGESFLHGMLTNDVRGLAAGAGLPAAFLTDTGKVVSDLRVYRDEDGFDLDCASWRLDHLCAGLDKYVIADDVEIERVEGHSVLVSLEGPATPEVAARAFEAGIPAPFGSSSVRFAGEPLTVHAVSDIGGAGLAVVGPLHLRDAVHAACEAAGARPSGLVALDTLRVESGVAWAGVDMGEDTLLMEIGLPETISRTKGCYLGQEVVERVSARGQVNRTLTGFAIEGGAHGLPKGSMDVRGDAGAVVGRITSWVDSPALGGLLGLGLLHRKGHDSGALEVVVGASSRPCRVTRFPGAGPIG